MDIPKFSQEYGTFMFSNKSNYVKCGFKVPINKSSNITRKTYLPLSNR